MIFKLQGEAGVITICEIVIESGPSDQEITWTIDYSPYQSFVNRDLKQMQQEP
jgi:hypothetical protein